MKNKIGNILKAGMTVKTLSVFLTVSLLLTAVPVLVGADTAGDKITESFSFTFSEPTITEDDGYAYISVDGAPLKNGDSRRPALPRYSSAVYLPLGATDIQVDFTHSPVKSKYVPEGTIVAPGPVPMLLTPPGSPFDYEVGDQTDDTIYNSHGPYGELFDYDIGIGIIGGIRQIIVNFHILPFTLSDVAGGIGKYIESATVTIEYEYGEETLPLDDEEDVDLLILAPSGFIADLKPLVGHKNAYMRTKLVCLDEIYDGTYWDMPEWTHDNQEKIKYFIYNATFEWNVTYVLAVGGFRSFWGLNRPEVQFPVRWTPCPREDEPGYVSDQYYSCCIKDFHGIPVFATWDENGDGDYHEDDAFPDVYFGRLACRNKMEVRTVVDKIIHYENNTYGEEWFNRMLTITGDGFGDLDDLAVAWDTNGIPTGDYTIYAQSCLQSNTSFVGPIDEVHVTVDHSVSSEVSFYEDDHLKIEPIDENQDAVYPGKPVAEIVTPQDFDILGNTNVQFNPPEAYCSDYTGWGRVEYGAGIIGIRSKSYDPSPKDDLNPASDFGSHTRVTIWVNNSDGVTVLPPITRQSEMFYEGEMECQKALDFMTSDFEKIKLWTSNGNWTGMWDVIKKISEGQGFVYFAGHGNPMSWGDHLPGIPGGRDDGMINGLKNFNLDFGWARYESEEGDPFFPMDQLTNGYKQSITLVGGCHNAMIDTSFMRLLADPHDVLFTVMHGAWIPETFDWWLARMPQGGSMATIGCSGLGYGYLGVLSITGLGGWINPQFFRNYRYGGDGINKDILGEVFTKTLIDFAEGDALQGYDMKTFEEWMFLGDPSLKMGGYPPSTGSLDEPLVDPIVIGDLVPAPGRLLTNITNNVYDNFTYFDWEIKIEGASPLGRYFGVTGTIFEELLRGRVLQGGYTTDFVTRLRLDETLEISSDPVFGFGHIEVNVTVLKDDETLVYKTEDGFLFLNRLILDHPEE